MKNLFLIDGAAGVGKSDLIQYMNDNNKATAFITKVSTRPIREYEKNSDHILDLVHITHEEFDNKKFDYWYKYHKNFYGFNKMDIKKAFEKHDSVFIIIRDHETIQKLKKDYQNYNVVSLFIYTDRDLIKQRLEQEEHTQDDIKDRLDKLEKAFTSYLENAEYYDDVIVNVGTKSDYTRICKKIIKKHESRNATIDNQIFVMMNFNSKMEDVLREFKLAAAKVNPSLIVKRLDEQKGSYQITDKILENIRKADLIICDLTHERPNVYYELGYARALGKRIISCAHEDTVLHFDIRNFRTLLYKNMSDLGRQMSDEISYYYTDSE